MSVITTPATHGIEGVIYIISKLPSTLYSTAIFFTYVSSYRMIFALITIRIVIVARCSKDNNGLMSGFDCSQSDRREITSCRSQKCSVLVHYRDKEFICQLLFLACATKLVSCLFCAATFINFVRNLQKPIIVKIIALICFNTNGWICRETRQCW